MDLKDFLGIFRKRAKLFFGIVAVSFVIVFIWQKNQPENFQATLLINIGRASVQNTAEYAYDNFYRLQADERFADTVVRWLGSPRVVEDIYRTSGIDPGTIGVRDLKTIFGAKRLSSQVIEVSYNNPDEKLVQEISGAAVSILNQYAESLNKDNKETNWFTVIGSSPVIRDARIPLPIALLLGLAGGVFIGFWTVLLRHYFQFTKNNKE